MINKGKISFGCIVMLIIFGIAAYSLYIIIPIKVKASEMKKVVENYSTQGSLFTDEQILKGILEKAEQLNLPITEKNVKIRRASGYITVEVNYTVPIDIMGYKTELKFNPKYENPLF